MTFSKEFGLFFFFFTSNLLPIINGSMDQVNNNSRIHFGNPYFKLNICLIFNHSTLSTLPIYY